MSSRERILASVRAHLPKLDRPLPAIPDFHATDSGDLIQKFVKNLNAMGGKMLPDADNPLDSVRRRLSEAGETCSMVPGISGSRALSSYGQPSDLANIDIAVLRAAFAVAETGSICLTDRLLGINGLGYLPQHLIIFLDPSEILENLHDAYGRTEWQAANYAVLQTGPSATADIEGVLIHGAQGVRSLTVVLYPKDPEFG